MLRQKLDPGESEAIALALELGADLLIDEAAGRAEAQRLGIRPIGVLAVLVRGKQLGRIDKVMPLVERLRNEYGFFLSPELIRVIRERAVE
jgi:predicted nucleic acid-binding protein